MLKLAKNAVAVMAMTGTALAPIMVSPAFATPTDTVSPADLFDDTRELMQAQCDLLAASAQANDDDPDDVWFAELRVGSPSYKSGPIQVGERIIDEDTRIGVGFVPGSTEIEGEPYRIGGSQNMFGIQLVNGGRFTSSTYEYEAEFDSTYTWSYDCDVFEDDYTPAVFEDRPVEGFYRQADDGVGGDDNDATGPRRDCEAGRVPRPGEPGWGEDVLIAGGTRVRCEFVETGPGGLVEVEPEKNVVTLQFTSSFTIDQDQTDLLKGFEANGEGFATSETFSNGQVVVCISPSTTGSRGNPGAWRQQNGYTGPNCNTTYFNTAPWGAGTDSSRGNYNSVPST